MSETHSTSGPEIPAWRRTILYYAAWDALTPMTDVILARLGYQILLPETFDRLRSADPSLRAAMWLVDERRLDQIPDAAADGSEARVPIVLMTGKQGTTGSDPRVVGAVKRPAGIHDLYRLMQQVFEDRPRSTPRVPAQMPVRCESGGESWQSRVVSISENGCLIRSPEAVLLGQTLQLEFVLPRGSTLALEGEATYQLLPDTGIVFNALPPSSREALSQFVTDTILA